MTGPLAWNSKVATRFAPFPSVRQNPSARAEMCQQMGQLMAQRSIDFTGPEFLQSWIKQNKAALEISSTHCRARSFALGRDQAPVSRQAWTKGAADKSIVIEVPNRCLVCNGIE